MTRHKDLKRIIRTRMKKTGESYTAARAHVIAKPNIRRPATPPAIDTSSAGMSDAKIAEKTGRSWTEWVRALDAEGAAARPHREIAALVHSKYGIGEWWAQSVTVGYERMKGLRARGQRLGGTFEATKSRTFNVPVTALFTAWTDDAMRRGWLTGVQARVRTATAPKSIRLQWPDGTIIAVGFTKKSEAKSAVALSHPNLPDKATADKTKMFWSERLDALASLLASNR